MHLCPHFFPYPHLVYAYLSTYSDSFKVRVRLHHSLSKNPSRRIIYHCGKCPSPYTGLQDPGWSSFPPDLSSNLVSLAHSSAATATSFLFPGPLRLLILRSGTLFPRYPHEFSSLLPGFCSRVISEIFLDHQNKMASPPSTSIPSPLYYSSLEHLSQSDLLVCYLFVIWSHSRNISFRSLFPHWFIVNACNSASCRFNKYLLNESMQNRLHFSVGISLIVYYE